MEKRTPIQKSIVRHKLKEIDRHPFKKVASPAHDKALRKTAKTKHISNLFRTYGDEGKKSVGSFESRLDKYAKFKHK